MKCRRYVLAAVVAAALWVAPTAALAASAVATPTAPVSAGATDVQFWMAAKPSEAVVIVSMTIPDSVELPVTVRLPLVEGMVVDWAGEISGGDVSQDLQRDYATKKGAGGSYVEFVVSEFRMAQVDLSGKPHTENDDEVSAVFEYVQSTESSQTTFSVRTPAIASDVRIDPKPEGQPTTNELGESLYVLEPLEMKPGDSLTVDVTYSMQLPGVPGSEGDAAINTLIGALAAVVVVVIVVLVVVSRRSSSGGRRSGA